MSISLIKIIALAFFIYLSVDSFRKIGLVKKDVESELVNPKTGRTFQKRYRRNGVIYGLIAIAAFISLFFKIAPLGE
jgi:hypothetical protein